MQTTLEVRPRTTDPTEDGDRFLREMVGALAETLEGAVGQRQAEGFLNLVAARIARAADRAARRREGAPALDASGVAEALVALKRRIGGEFRVESVDADRIELVGRRCPFGEAVRGRASLCAMTSGVVGRVAADNLGFARVDVGAAIARGDACCRVTIWLRDAPGRTGRPFEGASRAPR